MNMPLLMTDEIVKAMTDLGFDVTTCRQVIVFDYHEKNVAIVSFNDEHKFSFHYKEPESRWHESLTVTVDHVLTVKEFNELLNISMLPNYCAQYDTTVRGRILADIEG